MHIDICLTRRFGRGGGTREIDYKLVWYPQTEERKDYGTDSCVLQNSARNTRNGGEGREDGGTAKRGGGTAKRGGG